MFIPGVYRLRRSCRLVFTSLLLVAVLSPLHGQEDEFQKWLKKDREKFEEFKAKDDREFAEFLKKEWRAMQVFAGQSAFEKPKPVKAPVFVPSPEREAQPEPPSPPVKIPVLPRQQAPTPKPEPEVQNEPKPAPPPPSQPVVPKKEELKVEVGSAIVLDGIVFGTGKAVIKPESESILEKAYNTLEQNPEIKIEIRGHTDNTGSRSTNMRVSQARADAVRAWLVKKGISSKRVTAKGYGPDFPIGDNKTPEGRQKNRRIEFFRLGDEPVAAAPQPKVQPEPSPKAQPPTQPNVEPTAAPQPPMAVVPEPSAKAEQPPPPDFGPPPDLLPNTSRMDMTFFDVPFTLRRDNRLMAAPVSQWNNESISDFWLFLSKTQYDDLLKQAKTKRDQLGLNDWGYAQLLYDIGKGILGNSQAQATLFTWFMLLKSGYDMRVGYANNIIYLLLPTENKLYSIPYLTFTNKGISRRFYALNPDPQARELSGQLYTYNGSYADASSEMSFDVRQIPRLRNGVGSKTLLFRYRGKEYNAPVSYSSDAVGFFANYPQTNFEVYFNARPSREASESLVNFLAPLIRGSSELDAVNLLLHFVQTAFEYETDDQQFGREKPFFPDETLYYKACDCEDRSVLLAYLVRRLTGLEVVGLDFPGHMATAVRFSVDVPGDFVMDGGKKYVTCDPTYINALVGDRMPEFKNVSPHIIPLPPLGGM